MDRVEFFLVYVYPRLLQGVLLLIVPLVWRVRGRLLSPAARRGWPWGAAATLAALAARAWLATPEHQVYYDEFCHLDIARNLWRFGALAESLLNAPGLRPELSTTLWPGTFHASLALLHGPFGGGEGVAFAFNAALGALTAAVLFVLAADYLDDAPAAGLAALLLAVHPLHLRYSASTDLSIGSLFWACAALAALRAHARRPDAPTRALLLAALTLAVHSRLENFILIPLFAWHLRRADRRLFPARRFAALDAAFAAGCLPVLALVARNRAAGFPGFAEAPAAIARTLADHAARDAAYLLSPSSPNLLVTALFAAGCAAAWRRRRDDARFALAWTAAFTAFYASYVRGDFGAGDGERYSLILLAPLLIGAAGGVKALAARLRLPGAAAAATAGFLALSVPAYLRPAPALSSERAFLLERAPSLAPGAIVIAFSPPLVAASAGLPAVHSSLIIERRKAWTELPDERTRTLILFEDFWSRQLPAQAAALRAELARDYDFAPPERGGGAALYRLTRRQ